jgi:hypothetical protein
MSHHVEAFIKLADQIRKMEGDRRAARDRISDLPVGRHADGLVTVYKVRRHKVRAHYRSEHVAVRYNGK